MPSKPKIHKVVRYTVKKNGHTTMHRTKTAAKKKAEGVVHRHHRKRRVV